MQLAETLLREAESVATRSERRRSRRLGRLIGDPAARELTFALTDRVMRVEDSVRSMRELRRITSAPIPAALGPIDRAGLRLATVASRAAPHLVARLVRARIAIESRGVILSASDRRFSRHVARRSAEGTAVNVNVLGEAILGDDEAEARFESVARFVRRADVDYVSVKISALCANLDVLAYEFSVTRIADQLRRLYRLAAHADPPTFVNLDMEEYRDLHLTADAFRRVLDEDEFLPLRAGIALQAYIPDSHDVFDELASWAAQRHTRGGAAIKVRLVKGANLAMEEVEAELAGWPAAPYPSKADVDASYKRLLDAMLSAGPGVRLGVASHNLFDVAWALRQRGRWGGAGRTDIEMLEGMAPAQARAVRHAAGGLVLYAPVVEAADFSAAIAYLSRRLDENAGPQNFLRALFSITPGSPSWDAERRRFEIAVASRTVVSTRPRRTQDRAGEHRRFEPDAPFANEPDTDFTLASNRSWIAHHLGRARPAPPPVPIETIMGIDAVVARAAAWTTTTTAERRRILTRCAEVMAADRGRTIAVMARETGKTVREGDPEVSEGIDFARWAAAATFELDRLPTHEPIGVVLVAGPWNFPYAIPANGVVAALAAGNSVILKPAPEATATATELVRQLHAGGVPDDALQLAICPENEVGRRLITHDAIGTVLLTGAYETARMFLDWKPSLRLIAETSGKNAIVVTALADRDLAIHDVVRSAFGHAGQKCSAASLAILEAPLYDNDVFLQRLADAVRSLRVGPATDLSTVMGPLIRAPGDKLRRALTRLDPGERWLVEPRPPDDDVTWTPGVKMGVAEGSWFHVTECFGPVLGIMRARDLDHAIRLQNATPYGLTGGIHSLSPAEIDTWLDRVEVGNTYVNRHITGAIVRRQPFGGWKRSSVGPGAKTGGPNDLIRLTRFRAPDVLPSVDEAAASYAAWWDRQFGAAIDASGLRSEENVLRYRPVARVLVHVDAGTTEHELALLRLAASRAGVPITVGDASALASCERLRLLAPAGEELLRAAHDHDVRVDDTPVTGDGRIELPCWLREQAISRTRHRHGRIPAAD